MLKSWGAPRPRHSSPASWYRRSCPTPSASHLSPTVGLLHSITASGMPFTNTTMSGMMWSLVPRTLYCRVTRNSLFSGWSKSMKRTVRLCLPFPPSVSRAIP